MHCLGARQARVGLAMLPIRKTRPSHSPNKTPLRCVGARGAIRWLRVGLGLPFLAAAAGARADRIHCSVPGPVRIFQLSSILSSGSPTARKAARGSIDRLGRGERRRVGWSAYLQCSVSVRARQSNSSPRTANGLHRLHRALTGHFHHCLDRVDSLSVSGRDAIMT
jgi:hypothetical protein